RLRERLAERRGLARQDAVRALDERDLTAEATHDLRQLRPDRAAAEHEQTPRDGGHRGRLAVRPDAVELAQAGNRRDDGVGAVREDDVVRGVPRAVDLHDAGSGEPPGTTQKCDVAV